MKLLNESEKHRFLHLMYARRATILGVKEKDYYQHVADEIYLEDVITNEKTTDIRFKEVISFIENDAANALKLLIELRENPKYCFPYTEKWNLKLSEAL